MGKASVSYVCQECGYRNPRWLGRCPECREYNSLVEEVEAGVAQKRPRMSDLGRPVRIGEVSAADHPRFSTGIGELDRVLGGGIVPGSVLLLGGDPGIGKSTILLQMAQRLAAGKRRVLYVSAEESVQQLRLRADRLGVDADELFVVSETSTERIAAYAEELRPAVVVVDSIQMVYRPELPSAPGTVGQVRECTADLVYFAKRTGIAVVIVGHVTKEGHLAGPRTLEHLVDAVFYFEGERYHAYRVLRAVKNRFGSTQEVGIFEMRARGLVEVANPNEVFLSPDRQGRAGSAVVPTLLGTRTLLVEMQGLTNMVRTERPPMRRTSGVDPNRVAMILAVLTRRCGLEFYNTDVYVNAAGGVFIEEPAADLAVAAAIVSADRAVPADHRAVVFGEIGLGGEVRGVPHAEARVMEAARMGFHRAVFPRELIRSIEPPEGMEVAGAATVREALEALEIL